MAVSAEEVRHYFLEECACARGGGGEFLQEVVAEADAAGGVEGDDRFRGSGAEDILRRDRVAVDIELGTGRDVPDAVNRAAHDHEAIQIGDDAWFASEGASDVGERTEAEDGNFAGRTANFFADDFFAGMLADEAGDGEVGVAKAIGAMKLPGVVGRSGVARRSGADARVFGRIELLDAGLDVAGRLFGGDVALNGGDGDDFEPRVKEGECEGEGVVDSGIAVDDDFSGHGKTLVVRGNPIARMSLRVFGGIREALDWIEIEKLAYRDLP